jgi:glutathione synthase/RimK-type ligase-like ATP-grasp enzyme
MTQGAQVHVLYEHPDWLPPLVAGLEAEGLSYRLVPVVDGSVDPAEVPADGVWINRMSPSSHTRGHTESVALMGEILAWLESYGRRVVNGQRAYAIEMSKLRQDLALRRHGISTPRTVLAVGRDALLRAAESFEGSFITKHNQGGKGLGIEHFSSAELLSARIDAGDFDFGPRGQMIVQQYIAAPEPFITRVEICGGRFLYAMRSSTVGGFELCPADACQVPAANAPEVCPADGPSEKFTVSPLTADDPLVESYIRLCAAEGIDLAGIEFIEDREGRRYTYDINGTTNYNSGVGKQVGVDGMRELARYVRGLLGE